MTQESSIQDVMNDALDTRDTIVVAFAGFTVLIWDHFITFGDEVELIWKGDKGLLVYLFLLNRYLTPLGFIVNLVAYTLPSWGIEVSISCEHFVRYEGAMTSIGIEIVGLMMLLRVRAMYTHQRMIIWSVVLLFLIWVGVTAWLLTHGEAVQHASGVHSCSMIFDMSLSKIASASAWLPLLYDTVVFALTLNKTTPSIRNKQAGHVVRTLFADGILYYSIICAVNLVLTIMIVRAPEDVKNITAQLGLLLTPHQVAMMSRITLNLRKQALYGPSPTGSSTDTVYPFSRDWTHSERTRARSGSAATARSQFSRARAGSIQSNFPCLDSLSFSGNPALYPQRLTLSTIHSANLTPRAISPVTVSPTSEELPWEDPESKENGSCREIEAV
ncbi:hypothetical protein HYDPIDRAFT_157576 [Hydnomerulius pinastri MD-312]|uniref:DUF6533 domain-containing protein n=1 Tax=Hydnomerulius pinastri MD-312 TaxID=994086 RepID=A0A0C9VWY3_9AGAM|nr:hypothetical protein HYDPIDRAFT_157576 [Hydnomerulius pinastri MD-312]